MPEVSLTSSIDEYVTVISFIVVFALVIQNLSVDGEVLA